MKPNTHHIGSQARHRRNFLTHAALVGAALAVAPTAWASGIEPEGHDEDHESSDPWWSRSWAPGA